MIVPQTHHRHQKYRISGIRAVLGYRAYDSNPAVSHKGLGVASVNTTKCLLAAGIQAQTFGINKPQDIAALLDANKGEPITHVILSAPWIPTATIDQLCRRYPDVEFAVTCHSNVGFLQVDPFGIRLIKEEILLEQNSTNFSVAGNSLKYCRSIENSFGAPCVFLPNLYSLDGPPARRPLWRDNGGILRVGIFGAVRPQKNFFTAVAAATQLARQYNVQTEIWINSARRDAPETDVITRAALEWVSGNPRAVLKLLPWCPWPEFKKVIGSMHILLQPSYTESFNMVTADGVSEGVPSVVSDAIYWAPRHWQAMVDDQNDIARVAKSLLHDSHAVAEGYQALVDYNAAGLSCWIKYLTDS